MYKDITVRWYRDDAGFYITATGDESIGDSLLYLVDSEDTEDEAYFARLPTGGFGADTGIVLVWFEKFADAEAVAADWKKLQSENEPSS